MVIDVNDEQLEIAESPILVTLFGMFIDVNDEHPKKEPPPSVVTDLGITTFVITQFPFKIDTGGPSLPSLPLYNVVIFLPLISYGITNSVYILPASVNPVIVSPVVFTIK